MFKKILLVVMSVVLLQASPSLVAQQNATVEARDEAIIAVVTDQLAAFATGEEQRAFSHASPGIRAIFGDASRFMGMVRRSYGMIHDPSHYLIEGVEERDGTVYLKALFAGKASRIVRAWYSMQLQDDGSWKINGVSLERSDDRFT